jgi:putative transposase
MYHVTARGANRGAIFLDDEDRATFLRFLRLVVGAHDWRCHAYCLMTNHYHLVVETSRRELSEGMRRLNGRFAQHFNWRYGRCGHVFEGRYAARVVASEVHLEEACAHVFANPVRAGLCNSVDSWPWSGRIASGVAVAAS